LSVHILNGQEHIELQMGIGRNILQHPCDLCRDAVVIDEDRMADGEIDAAKIFDGGRGGEHDAVRCGQRRDRVATQQGIVEK
jgi:hypothetical protein